MNFNVNSLFSAQAAQAASFFKGQEKQSAEGSEAKEKLRKRALDEFISTNTKQIQKTQDASKPQF